MTETSILLREYAERGSESAFRQLVTQYVDLIFGAALRQVDGDSHRAEDIVQTVFTDLARKARTLPPNVMLGGWLHRHCCYVASKARRGEWRRAAREREAAAMQTTHGKEPPWSDVAGDLDDAINLLEQEDRDAILLRFFERQDFKAIGEAIGATENAAQKRVVRALEKLRLLLMERGVALSAAALLAGLTDQTVTAAPGGLAEKATESALSVSAVKTTAAAAGAGAVAWALWAGVAAAVALVLAVGFWSAKSKNADSQKISAASEVTAAAKSGAVQNAAAKVAVASETASTPDPASENGPSLRLTILADDSGVAIPNVPIEYRALEPKQVHKNLQSSRLGIASIPYTSNTTELRLITRVEGFADTRLFFETKTGGPIPAEYTLRLKRGLQIGGKVVNARGELVPGAAVDFNLPVVDPELASRRESHEVEAIHIVAENGTWQSTRIPEALLKRGHMDASHPDYAGSDSFHFPVNSAPMQQLLKGSHVFHLRDGATVGGIVLNRDGQPIPFADIMVGALQFTGTKEGKADGDGRFEIHGCPAGVSMVTASAKGYGAKTLRVDPPGLKEGYRLVLEPGRNLKLRVVSRAGEPIPRAYVWLKTISDEYLNKTNAPPLTQANFQPRTDAEGRAEWNEAYAAELVFDLEAKGYMRRNDAKVLANGEEQTLTLLPELRISGTVRDADSGAPVPQFRIIAGYPQELIPPGDTNRPIHWSSMPNHWTTFKDGKFSQAFDSPIVFGVSTSRFAFKFEADGYRPFVTRVVEEHEGSITFDVALKRAGVAKLTFLDANGKPAPEVDVVFPAPRQSLSLSGRGIARRFGEPIVSTDARGQVGFNAPDAAKIIAAGPAGFAMLNPADVPPDGIIRLQPWGRVQGKISRRGKPVSDWKLQLRPDFEREQIFLTAASATTDSDGRFTMDVAPAGRFGLTHMMAMPSPRSSGSEAGVTTAFAHIELKEIEVMPAVTTTVDYEDSTVTVEVRLRWPSGFRRAADHQVFCRATIPYPKPSEEEMKNPEALARWRSQPEIKAALKKMRFAQSKEVRPDVWICEGLSAGEWTVGAWVIDEPAVAGQPLKPALSASIQVRIPETMNEDKLALGELILTRPTSP